MPGHHVCHQWPVCTMWRLWVPLAGAQWLPRLMEDWTVDSGGLGMVALQQRSSSYFLLPLC